MEARAEDVDRSLALAAAVAAVKEEVDGQAHDRGGAETEGLDRWDCYENRHLKEEEEEDAAGAVVPEGETEDQAGGSLVAVVGASVAAAEGSLAWDLISGI